MKSTVQHTPLSDYDLKQRHLSTLPHSTTVLRTLYGFMSLHTDMQHVIVAIPAVLSTQPIKPYHADSAAPTNAVSPIAS